MPVYAFGPKQDTRPTPGEDAVNLAGNLANIYGQYKQGKATEAAQATLANPESTPMQQALAWAQLGQNQAAAQTVKQGGIQKVQADIANRFPDIASGGTQNIPGATPTIIPKTAAGSTRQPPNAQIPNDVVNATEGVPQQVQPQEAVTNEPQTFQQPAQEGPEQKLAKAQQFRQRAEAYNAAGLTPQANSDMSQATSLENQAIAQQKIQKTDERETRKETQQYVDKILDAYQGTKETEAILGQMTKLAEGGNLTTPGLAASLNALHIPLGVLNNPDTEEFDKLSNQLTRGIQKFYGSRILVSEFNNFLRQIPSLMNSEEGKQRIISNLEKALLPAKYEYATYKEILKKNGGKRPENLREQIIERLDPLLDKWAAEFKGDVKDMTVKNLPMPKSGSVRLTRDGKFYDFPEDQLQQRLQMGFNQP